MYYFLEKRLLPPCVYVSCVFISVCICAFAPGTNLICESILPPHFHYFLNNLVKRSSAWGRINKERLMKTEFWAGLLITNMVTDYWVMPRCSLSRRPSHIQKVHFNPGITADSYTTCSMFSVALVLLIQLSALFPRHFDSTVWGLYMQLYSCHINLCDGEASARRRWSWWCYSQLVFRVWITQLWKEVLTGAGCAKQMQARDEHLKQNWVLYSRVIR